MTTYRVDLDALDDTITFMQSTSDTVAAELAALDAHIAQLHDVWSGDAAGAQWAAHQEWSAGAAEMRAALDAMREAARTAHTNYSNAVAANQQMWG
ncbi:WXG100 family type VII secretion target [Jatrophihabitans sp. YIM 134969]